MNDTRDAAKWGLFHLLKVLDIDQGGRLHGEFAHAAQLLGLELPVVATPVPDPAPDGAFGDNGGQDNEAKGRPADDPTGIMLLADIRSIFAAKRVDRISSEDLCQALAGMKDRPWPESNLGKPITKERLAGLLRNFAIHPTTVWFPEKPLKGYHLQAFADAFSRCLPSPPGEPLCPLDPQKPWANEQGSQPRAEADAGVEATASPAAMG